jgi:hypothetical protein
MVAWPARKRAKEPAASYSEGAGGTFHKRSGDYGARLDRWVRRFNDV